MILLQNYIFKGHRTELLNNIYDILNLEKSPMQKKC